jgi:hypothetical protein
MTFLQLVETINRTPRARYTDFTFEDGFFLCDPKGITRETARRRYRETMGRKAPLIEDAVWFVAE